MSNIAKKPDQIPESYSPKKPDILSMAEATENICWPDHFILEKVPQEGVLFAGARCPGTFQFANEISLYLEYTGQSYGFEDYNGWRCDIVYTLIEALTGFAYCPGCVYETAEELKRVFDTLGFEYRQFFTSPKRDSYLSYEDMKRQIVYTLVHEKKPVIVRNLSPIFFGGVIIGYEQDGDVLIGWNYPAFDFSPNLNPVAARCEGWYRTDTSLIIIGNCNFSPKTEDVYFAGMKQAYRYGVIENPLLIDNITDWIRFLKMDKASCIAEVKRTLWVPGAWQDFTYDNLTDENILDALNSMADPLWCDYAERRYYAANFMRQARRYFPESKAEMESIAGMYWAIDSAMHEYIEFTGHDPIDEDKFWNPEVRAKMAQCVERCRDVEMQIAERLRILLENLECLVFNK